ncbi:hypothetical protein NDU88_002094 [Pleurodeles waltl]|uniref:Uncharacterized protein n=1 Tax=Pleurodeles waltl TaxID=8319 RepID=A0AAV7LND1_PLEWA|nr:hypothetical protein NDU88_002094 [Pleurodeles waltl]
MPWPSWNTNADKDDNSVLEQSAVDPWHKSKREVQRNSGELLHLLSGEKPTGETLNSPQEEEGENAPVTAVDTQDSEDEEAEYEDVDNRTSVTGQYFK